MELPTVQETAERLKVAPVTVRRSIAAGGLPAVRVLEEIDTGTTRAIIRVEEENERRARAMLRQYADNDFSLTDAISFAVMERLGIGHAFAFDRHFVQYGVAMHGPGPHP